MPEWVGPTAEYVAQGLVTSILLILVCIVASLLLGTLVGTLLTLPNRVVTAPLRAYVEVWRGLPIVVTLFFVFFALPILGFSVSVFVAAAVGLTLWGSANISEVVRGAVQSIPATQFEAAAALGLNWPRRMGYVVLPQATRRAIPPAVGIITNLTQGTALAALIGLLGVLEAAQRSIERLTLSTGATHAIPILGAVLVVFFVICFPLTLLSRWLERKLAL